MLFDWLGAVCNVSSIQHIVLKRRRSHVFSFFLVRMQHTPSILRISHHYQSAWINVIQYPVTLSTRYQSLVNDNSPHGPSTFVLYLFELIYLSSLFVSHGSLRYPTTLFVTNQTFSISFTLPTFTSFLTSSSRFCWIIFLLVLGPSCRPSSSPSIRSIDLRQVYFVS